MSRQSQFTGGPVSIDTGRKGHRPMGARYTAAPKPQLISQKHLQLIARRQDELHGLQMSLAMRLMELRKCLMNGARLEAGRFYFDPAAQTVRTSCDSSDSGDVPDGD